MADVLTEVREADEFGIKVPGEPEVDYGKVMERREKVITTLTGGVAGLMKKNGIEVIEGEARLAGDGRWPSASDTHEAKNIILATGSVKRPIPGAQFGGRVIGTEEAWALSELPQSIAVVGAGASGAEIASAYARLGIKRDAVRGAGPRAALRGRRHLQAGRARAEEAGHADLHQDVRGEHRDRRQAA